MESGALPRGIRSSDELLNCGREVIEQEAAALARLADSLGPEFSAACQLLLDCQGRIIVTGMGKSGIIGQKIAASLTSTGVPAHFLHPAEGVHGDLGVVHRSDVLLAISNSGESDELVTLLPPVRTLGVPVIAITRNAESTLARAATVVLPLVMLPEADMHNLVPSTSTTMTLALGDALTVALMLARHFMPEDFAVLHPQGMLGKRLTLQVASLLRGAATNPVVPETASFAEALHVITQFALGGTSVVAADGRLSGILTDGDVRRRIEGYATAGASVAEVLATPVGEVMTRQPTRISHTALAYDALQLMEQHQPRPIFILPVIDAAGAPLGMLHLHALVQAGFKTQRET